MKLQMKGSWNEIKGKLKQKYGQMTDDDLASPTAKRTSFWVASKKDWVEQKTSFELTSRTCDFITAWSASAPGFALSRPSRFVCPTLTRAQRPAVTY